MLFLRSAITFSEARTKAYQLADEINKVAPTISTRAESVNLRHGMVYIDADRTIMLIRLQRPTVYALIVSL